MQSVIVYRNPLEAAMWEGLMSGEFFPVIVAIVVFFAVFLTIHVQVIERFCGSFSKNAGLWSKLNLAFSAFVGFMVARYMYAAI